MCVWIQQRTTQKACRYVAAIVSMSINYAHDAIIGEFEREKTKELPDLKRKLAALKKKKKHIRSLNDRIASLRIELRSLESKRSKNKMVRQKIKGIKEEIIRLNADNGNMAGIVIEIEKIEQRIREIEDNTEENEYLLELGSMIFNESQSSNESVTVSPPKTTIKEQGQNLCCMISVPQLGIPPIRVSVWSTPTDLCRDLLAPYTGQYLLGAYESIKLNGEEILPDIVLWDVRTIKVVQGRTINQLTFTLKPCNAVYKVQVFESNTGDELTGVFSVEDWCSEHDISQLIGRAADLDDAFFLLPDADADANQKIRIRSDIGDAIRSIHGETIPSEDTVFVLLRSDRIVTRKRMNTTKSVSVRRDLLEGIIKQEKGEQRYEVFVEFVDMLSRLKLNGRAANAADRVIEQAHIKRQIDPDELTNNESTPVTKRRRRNRKKDTVSVSRRSGGGGNCCALCGSMLTYMRSEGAFVCQGYDEQCVDCDGNVEIVHKPCGYTVQTIDNGPSSLPFGTKVQGLNTTYKRINHFNEWLNHIQAKQRDKVPAYVIDAVREEFVKDRRTAKHEITKERVREYLKKLHKRYKHVKPKPLNFSRYYAQAILIVEKLGGSSPPTLTPQQESTMRWIFWMLEIAFKAVPEHILKGRQNFLPYPYVIYKICEILGHHHMLRSLTLLKSQARIRQHDRIWSYMVDYLSMDPIPTV